MRVFAVVATYRGDFDGVWFASTSRENCETARQQLVRKEVAVLAEDDGVYGWDWEKVKYTYDRIDLNEARAMAYSLAEFEVEVE